MNNDAELLLSWPLVLVIEDCFVPDAARYVLPAIGDLGDESARVTVRVWALEAQGEVEEGKN